MRVSVVIPARNAAATLPGQLAALAAQQDPPPLEVVVVDDGSSDATGDVVLAHQRDLPGLRLLRTPSRGANAARNAGVAATTAPLVLFCDADDEVRPGWARALADAMTDDGFDLVGGRLDDTRINPPEVVAVTERYADQLPAGRWLPYAVGACLGVRRTALELVGGFDERYRYGGTDVELCWRVQLAGGRIGYVPAAVVDYRRKGDTRSLARKGMLTGRSSARLERDFVPLGMPAPHDRPLRAAVRLGLDVPGALGDVRRRRLLAYRTGIWVGRAAERVRPST